MMFTILEHLKNRYMSQRAQGIVEYAIVIAFVIVIGWALLGHGEGLDTKVTAIFNNLSTLLTSASTKTTTT